MDASYFLFFIIGWIQGGAAIDWINELMANALPQVSINQCGSGGLVRAHWFWDAISKQGLCDGAVTYRGKSAAFWETRMLDLLVRYPVSNPLVKFELWENTDPGAMAMLRQLLRSEHPYVRVQACWCLESLERLTSREISALIKILRDDPMCSPRYCAARALSAYEFNRDSAVHCALAEGLKDTDASTRLVCAASLASAGLNDDDVIAVLLRVLQRLECYNYGHGFSTFQIGVNGKLSKADSFDVLKAVQIIQVYGSKASAAAPLLVGLLANDDEDTVGILYGAADALGCIGVKNARILNLLLARMKHDNPWVRISCARAYWRLTGERSQSRNVLLSILCDPNEWEGTRFQSLAELIRMGGFRGIRVPHFGGT